MVELTTVAFDASAGEATLDAIVLFTVLLLLACHGMARGWPAQLGGADLGDVREQQWRTLSVHLGPPGCPNIGL